MRVQIIAIPPIEAAMAMMMVKVVFVLEVAPLVGREVPVLFESEEVTVLTSVFRGGVLVGDDSGGESCGGGVGVLLCGVEVGEDGAGGVVVELEVGVDRLESELGLRMGGVEVLGEGEGDSDGDVFVFGDWRTQNVHTVGHFSGKGEIYAYRARAGRGGVDRTITLVGIFAFAVRANVNNVAY